MIITVGIEFVPHRFDIFLDQIESILQAMFEFVEELLQSTYGVYFQVNCRHLDINSIG